MQFNCWTLERAADYYFTVHKSEVAEELMLLAIELMEVAKSFILQICPWWRHPASRAFRACKVKQDHQTVHADV